MYVDFTRIGQQTLKNEYKLIYACKYSVAFTAQVSWNSHPYLNFCGHLLFKVSSIQTKNVQNVSKFSFTPLHKVGLTALIFTDLKLHQNFCKEFLYQISHKFKSSGLDITSQINW